MRSGRVTTEGDELYYEVRGEGSPLLLIPGGGGDGGSYSLIADILSDQFKVITYDRRATATLLKLSVPLAPGTMSMTGPLPWVS